MKARETKEEEGANRDAKLGKWRKHTCSGRLLGGPHACSIVDSTLQKLELNLRLTSLSFRQHGEYVFWVDENNIEDNIRDGLANSQARAPGRNTEIIVTGHGACFQEISPFA